MPPFTLGRIIAFAVLVIALVAGALVVLGQGVTISPLLLLVLVGALAVAFLVG